MHIVYTCSPDRKLQLLTSMRSLFSSGTAFDRITIISVDGELVLPKEYVSEKITIKKVPNIGPDFWMLNKIHLCDIQDPEILHIDIDTIILKPLNSIGLNVAGDMVGRTTTAYEQPNWPEPAWKTYLAKFGAKTYFPYLNNGLVLFRNGAHQGLAKPWQEITRKLLAGSDFPLHSRTHSNQLAFSLAAGARGISYGLLSSKDHAYGWDNDPFEDVVVYHTGGTKFIDYALRVNAQTKILGKGFSGLYASLRLHQFKNHIKSRLIRYKNQAVVFVKSILGR